ncbi:S8 family serine peptidase [Ornithinimicrobium cerasi]|uniref:Peptidase inhibitor I9 n=1 Tax=Ornithinimicrobium cerasi TaxID=2248773 RepID=A0A285VE37_9MICO|nr:S8 family serine peptidase [Ornithinimicrobium cerasi]SOC52263.1 Peptidase inhibitor I9 [Ornithinimicrobium cerasi]
MRSLRHARMSALAVALAAGLVLPPAAWSAPNPSPDQTGAEAVARAELAEELGLEVDDPGLARAAEAAEQGETPAGDLSALTATSTGEKAAEPADVFTEESETGVWLVTLESDPLATYDGDVRGLAATAVGATGEAQLDVTSEASEAYLDHLEGEHERVLAEMAEELGHDIEVTQTYHHAVNGMAVRATAEEAAALSVLPAVAHVEPEQVWELETDVSNELLGTPAIWGGATGTELATRGEGVVTGMIDSGVNPEHPSFAATDGDGWTHTNPLGEGVYLGVCASGAPRPEDICNDKLIGAYDFTGTGAVDTNGHGSHVGSTMAGNAHDAVFTVGSTEFTRGVSGVAPRANVVSFKVCSPGCPSSYTVAAVDRAIADGVDVLNYSISGPDDPWDNTVDLAFLAAYDAGIYIAASAGNTGPGVGTVTKTAPWNATVAATNSPRLIAQALSVTGPAPVPAELEQLAAVPGSGPGVTAPIAAPLKESSGNVRGCTAFPAGTFAGSFALIERGDCDFAVKVRNAAAAGALGVVVTNQVPGPPVVMGALEATTIPAVMTSDVDGAPLRDFVRANPDAEVLLDSAAVLTETPAWAGMVSDFSGRGPSDFDLLNPTFAAPGRNILAATAASDGEPVQYEFMQGTSMSSPHGAGSGALLRGLHPDWTPAMIRSALASTADPEGMLKHDGVTPADAFDVGSGFLDLEAAGRVGLVLDETTTNFLAADPATGGEPRTLNLPAVADNACPDTCTFERTVTNVAEVATAYTVSTDGAPGLAVGVEPAAFTIEPGGTQVLTVTVDVSADTRGEWLMGSIALSTEGTHLGGAAVADVRYPVAVLPANPTMELAPTSIALTLGVDEQESRPVTVRNTGTATLSWAVSEDGEDCALPAWASADPTSGTVPVGESGQVVVGIDTSSMPGGTYEATLCLTSDDPDRPLAEVPVTLTVVEIPVVDVSRDEIEVTVPANRTTTETLEVTNTGYGVLDWTLDDPEAGPSQDRVEMLRKGVLLTATSTSPRQALAFDPVDGTLLDADFIPSTGSSGTPQSVLAMPDESGFLVSNQTSNVIRKFDLDGNDLGVFAPRGGADVSILQNMRGMTWSPDGTLVVTAASGGNANSLVEFDQEGSYLGTYVEPGLDGLDGPWSALFRDDDLLVSANGSSTIHSYSVDGSSANAPFSTAAAWPVQLAETEEGSVLSAVWTTRTGALPVGVHEFSADGELLWSGAVPRATNYGGVQPLENGNLLITTGQGVYEVSRDGAIEQEWAGPRTRMIHEARMPDLRACQTPDEVPWLSVAPSSGSQARQETTTVEVTLDPTGLVEGSYTAQLCVSSNDDARPYVPVDVTMTVETPACDTTVRGRVNGGLTVTEAVCVQPGATISGGVTVQPGGILLMDGARVNGDLVSTDADWVEVTGSTVTGDVTITGTVRRLVFEGNVVRGSTRIEDNPATG